MTVRDLDDLSPTEARDFVMARLGAAAAAATSVQEGLLDVLGAIAGGDHEFDRPEMLDYLDEQLGEATRAVQLARDLIDQIDPEESEPEVPEGDGHDDDEGGEGDDDE